MPNLENIVPPLELCRKIPQGEFAESALVWLQERGSGLWWINAREFDKTSYAAEIPAPTLAEIMHELCQAGEPVDVTLWRTGQCAVMVNREEEECEEVSCFPAEAALKLWLGLNNERNENGKN